MKQECQSRIYFATDFMTLQTTGMTAMHRETNAIRTNSTASGLFWQKPFVICNLVELFLLIFKMVGLSEVFGSILT